MTDWLNILGWTQTHLDELRFMGFDILKEGQYQRARTYFESLIILDPSSIYDKQTLGAIYTELNEHQKALDTLNEVLASEPEDAPSLLNKTKVLIGLGQITEALVIAQSLTRSKDKTIANDAEALILAYSKQ